MPVFFAVKAKHDLRETGGLGNFLEKARRIRKQNRNRCLRPDDQIGRMVSLLRRGGGEFDLAVQKNRAFLWIPFFVLRGVRLDDADIRATCQILLLRCQ